MNNKKTNIFWDSWIMFKRCMRISMRHPEALFMAALTPFFLMFLFGTLFGNVVDIGDVNYIDFIVPGIILQCIAQASQHSAISVSTDMTNGIMDRFRSMPISKSSVLIGHTGAGVVRNAIAIAVIIGTAFILGFNPQAGFLGWLAVVGLLALVNITISSLAVLCGLISKTPEGAGGMMFPLFILPFISSGFVPLDTMPAGLKWFAEVQPMTPIIDSMRALMMDLPLGNSLWIALAWCVGIIVVAFAISLRVFRQKLS